MKRGGLLIYSINNSENNKNKLLPNVATYLICSALLSYKNICILLKYVDCKTYNAIAYK